MDPTHTTTDCSGGRSQQTASASTWPGLRGDAKEKLLPLNNQNPELITTIPDHITTAYITQHQNIAHTCHIRHIWTCTGHQYICCTYVQRYADTYIHFHMCIICMLLYIVYIVNLLFVIYAYLRICRIPFRCTFVPATNAHVTNKTLNLES